MKPFTGAARTFRHRVARLARRGRRWLGRRRGPGTVWLSLGAAALVVAALWVTPLPFFVESPGAAFDASRFVRLEDARLGPRSQFLILTISVRRANILWWVYGHLDRDRVRVKSRAQFLGPYPSYGEYERDSRRQMEQSRHYAAAAALSALGYKITVEPLGARISAVLPGVPAARSLTPGDLVIAVDGHPVRSPGDLTAHLRGLEGAQPVRVAVRRDGREVLVTVPTEPHPDRAGVRLGVLLESAHRVDLPFPVRIDPMHVTGPSAGLTLALEILEQLTEDDLGGGRVIAATGTVDPYGVVGEIGNLAQKVFVAEAAGADLLLVPAVQADLARRVAKQVTVVPVRTVSEALRWLREHPERAGAALLFGQTRDQRVDNGNRRSV